MNVKVHPYKPLMSGKLWYKFTNWDICDLNWIDVRSFPWWSICIPVMYLTCRSLIKRSDWKSDTLFRSRAFIFLCVSTSVFIQQRQQHSLHTTQHQDLKTLTTLPSLWISHLSHAHVTVELTKSKKTCNEMWSSHLRSQSDLLTRTACCFGE